MTDKPKKDKWKGGQRPDYFLEKPLIGKWFHSVRRDKKGRPLYVKWQGQVVGELGWDSGLFVVQLYEWGMGHPNGFATVPAQDMVGWQFYYSSEDMVNAYERHLVVGCYGEDRRERMR